MSLTERYGRLAAAGSTMPPLALCSLAAVCRNNGFAVSIIDAACGELSHEQVVDALVSRKPRYVGITAMTCGIHSAARIANLIKRKRPDILTLIGGPHVTALPAETMRIFPEFDVGCIGEGEETLVDYMRAMQAGSSGDNVSGLVHRKGGAICLSGARPFIEDLNSLPFPAWDLLEGFPDRYVPAAIRCRRLPASHLVTSRGCPMKCTFCDRSVFGNRYRLFSVEYTFEMIKTLVNTYNVRDILFEDDSFTLHKERVLALCELIGKNNLRFSWSCLGRVDSIDATLLKIMRRAGCWQIGFGIESGNAGILDSVHKSIDLDRIREALAVTRRARILTKGFFVLGLPHETPDSIRETIRFAKTVALNDISVSFCTPFPGTVLGEHARESGDVDPDWNKMNLMNAVFVPKGFTKKQLEEFHAAFFRQFYFRPGIILDYVFRCIRNPGLLWRILWILPSFFHPAFRKAARSRPLVSTHR